MTSSPSTRAVPLVGRYGSFVCLIDEADYERFCMHRWYVTKDHYVGTILALGGRKRKKLRLHRWLMDNPKGQCVDHINRDRLDNRRANLRVCSKRMNCANKVKTENTDGVSWDKRAKRWRACVGDGATGYRGSFIDHNAALNCYNYWAREVYGSFASLNECTPMIRSDWEAARCRKAKPASRYTHLYWESRSQRWVAMVHNRRLKLKRFVGQFQTEEEASAAYNAYLHTHDIDLPPSQLRT